MANKRSEQYAELIQQHDTQQLVCQNAWVLANIPLIKKTLESFDFTHGKTLIIDGKAISNIDSSGAWQLQKLIYKLQKANIKVQLQNFTKEQELLLKMLQDQTANFKGIPKKKYFNWLYQFGESTFYHLQQVLTFLSFIGEITSVAIKTIHQPRLRPLLSTIEITGFQALPLLALLSFMIGVVIAYQMGLQLLNYGANIYIVDLTGFSIFREFGPLLTAIIVTGRTGSAFTAQLGTMKLNEELDALRTMGISPIELLVLPRILGLIIVMPLLTIWADIFGVIGSMLMAKNMLAINMADFLIRFQQAVTIHSLLVGLCKTPVFAMLIAGIGCFQGMQVSGGADSVGKQTTKSVVQAIFCIIIADALFSVLFSSLKI